MINYFCNTDEIEYNALEQLNLFVEKGIDNISVFPDIHYCSEKNLPVGVAFTTTDKFYPLITGKDVGCGVMYLKFKKEDYIKPFDKTKHYRAFDKESYKMTDDGLGGGNHFLSIEEGDDDFMYIICHTGSRNLGIAFYQKFLKMIEEFNYEEGLNDTFLPKEKINPELISKYWSVLGFASFRRKQFVTKTLLFLQKNGYVKSDNTLSVQMAESLFPDEGKANGVHFKIQDSFHNHLRFNDNEIIHRKGSTELIPNEEVVIPLSMTRGSLIVKPGYDKKALKLANYSCSHGAGRKLSRIDSLKHWNSGMKESERKVYRNNFSELLDRSGDFSKGYIQEFDFAYKSSDEILKSQPFLIKVAKTTPVATVKFTEI